MTAGEIVALILAAVMAAGWVWAEWRVIDHVDRTERARHDLNESEASRLRWEARARRLNAEVAIARDQERKAVRR